MASTFYSCFVMCIRAIFFNGYALVAASYELMFIVPVLLKSSTDCGSVFKSHRTDYV